MPVYKIGRPDGNCIWGIWKIEEQLPVLMDSLQGLSLTDGFYTINHDKKKVDWLTSRMLIKHLIENTGDIFYGISNDKNGKPHLNNYDYHLSLSHCQEYTVAIIHKLKKVGIDIEIIREKIRTVSPKFLSEDELKDAGGHLNKLCVSWCIKEVLYKIHSIRNISLKNNMRIYPFDFNEAGGHCLAVLSVNEYSEVFNIQYLRIGNHFIAFNYYSYNQ